MTAAPDRRWVTGVAVVAIGWVILGLFTDGSRLPSPGEPTGEVGLPAPADYDADGTADLAVLTWSTSGGATSRRFTSNDIPDPPI